MRLFWREMPGLQTFCRHASEMPDIGGRGLERDLSELKEHATHRLIFLEAERILSLGTVVLDLDSRFMKSSGGKASQKPDLIAVDSTGRLVIVEAKRRIRGEANAKALIDQAHRSAAWLASHVGASSMHNLRRGYYLRYVCDTASELESCRKLHEIQRSPGFRGWNWSQHVVIVAAQIDGKIRTQVLGLIPHARPYSVSVLEISATQRDYGKPILNQVRPVIPERGPTEPPALKVEDAIGLSVQHEYHPLSPFFKEVARCLVDKLSDLGIDTKLRAKKFQGWWKNISFMHPWGLDLGGVQFEISKHRSESEVRLLCGDRRDLVEDLYPVLCRSEIKDRIATSMCISPAQLLVERRKFVIKHRFDRGLVETRDARRISAIFAGFIRAVYPVVRERIW